MLFKNQKSLKLPATTSIALVASFISLAFGVILFLSDWYQDRIYRPEVTSTMTVKMPMESDAVKKTKQQVKLVILKKDLKKWELIKSENLDVICVNADEDHKNHLVSSSRAIGKFASKNLKSGVHLKKTDIESDIRKIYFLRFPGCVQHGPTVNK